MKRLQLFSSILLLFAFLVIDHHEASAQRWKRKKKETLYARNKRKDLTPIYVGIGVKQPSAQFHTTGSVRFQGLVSNNTTDRFLTMDANGNLFWRDAISLAGTAWLLTGNAPGNTDFLGTTGAQDLRIRTNNIQRAVITSSGSIGIGVAAPTAQLHTSGTVRFEGVVSDPTASRMAMFDNSGNLFYRDITTLQTNFWGLSGNAGTNPANNFIGTTDNNRLVFRTNNTERMTILPSGKTGLGTSNPLVTLHVTDLAGTMTGFPYEPAIFEKGSDMKISVLNSNPNPVGAGGSSGGSAIALGYSNFTIGGSFPGYEMQYGANTATAGFLRFNYILRNAAGTVTSAVGNIMIMDNTGNVGVNLGSVTPNGAPNLPTAKFHTNGAIRFQGLPTGTGTALVVDANGNVLVSTGSTTGWGLTGNAGTTPATNFLGTTDNNRLVIRTNNTEKMTVMPAGQVGINTTNPQFMLEVTNNNATGGNQIKVNGVAPTITFDGGISINDAGRLGYATQNNNFVGGAVPGDFIVQNLGNAASLIFGVGGGGSGNGIERARINAVGYFGIATTAPTAKLHVNCALVGGQPNPSNIRFESLQTGTGNALVIDANGYVFKSATLTGKEAQDLVDKVNQLTAEVETLKSLVNTMKSGYVTVTESQNEPVLYQNAPNPFKNTTIIRYFLPAGTKAASLQVTNFQGTIIKTFTLNGEGGEQSKTINAGELSAGTYLYTLFINGKKADTKKMILTR